MKEESLLILEINMEKQTNQIQVVTVLTIKITFLLLRFSKSQSIGTIQAVTKLYSRFKQLKRMVP